ncbi:MAG TPA: NDP-sugar synthase [Gaiellaceae bacterium]|nr:NDP-sugar synthase [Gaiellaceae bacterium]
MKAVLLAAGRGTRLAPLTDTTPKILVPLRGRPLLEHQLRYLERNGVAEVGLNLHHHADQVLSFLEGFDTPLSIRVSRERELLGTAGALLSFGDFVGERFVVLYGDVLTDADLVALLEQHRIRGGLATIAYYRSLETAGKGVLELDPDERVTSFAEKSVVRAGEALINAGLYALDSKILAHIHEGADFGHDLWPASLADGETLWGHELRGYLRDIGSPQALQEAEKDLDEGRFEW